MMCSSLIGELKTSNGFKKVLEYWIQNRKNKHNILLSFATKKCDN